MKRYVTELAEDRLADLEKIRSSFQQKRINIFNGKMDSSFDRALIADIAMTTISIEKIKKALTECENGMISDYMAVKAIIDA